jgi:HPt (histidine-containing phosphotransfer) domain-containing protein
MESKSSILVESGPGDEEATVRAIEKALQGIEHYTKYPDVDWTDFMEGIGNDEEFLDSVFGDLVEEVHQRLPLIRGELSKLPAETDYDKVRQCAHTITGSAAYLALKSVSCAAEAVREVAKCARLKYTDIRLLHAKLVSLAEDLETAFQWVVDDYGTRSNTRSDCRKAERVGSNK